jgi:hypothetical protein
LAAYDAPETPVTREEDRLVDTDGTAWEIGMEQLTSADSSLDRVTGDIGMWWAIRPKFEDARIVGLE